MKAVFATKANPTYDDLPEHRYHFPATYLREVESAKGDWIVYYEPRRDTADPSSRRGRQAYFGTARVTSVEPDRATPGHYYAFVDEFLPFPRAVPFREGNHYYESRLQRNDGATSKGAFGRSVRPIPDEEFERILQAAMAGILGNRQDSETVGFSEEPATYERSIVAKLVSRPIRDAAFAAAVKEAYENTCAITGLRLINGGGRAEVQAAHIRGVAAQGPDSPRNGLALSATVHWMFDRGLLSASDQFRLLVANDHVPESARRLFLPEGKLLVPVRADLQPHPQFLAWHRQNVFKG